ncbi:MAG TPA: hypothetical protein VLA84_04380 [Microcoleus sp.]|nr:hypothetical protein [Microcoleus sp.]
MTNLTTLFRTLAWAWIIVIGGLMITPGGIDCIACGPLLTRFMGVISILIGISGLAIGFREQSVSG